MGCNSSITSAEIIKNNKEIGKLIAKFDENSCENITKEEREIISRTWKQLTNDLAANGLQVFLRIFEVCPEVKKLFRIENVRHSDVARNPIIKGHGARFMQAIGAAVDRLEDLHLNNSDELDNLLLLLGHQHKNYVGFKPDYFDIFYQALMWQWERCMDKGFTADVATAWSHLFVYVMLRLKEGYYKQDL